MIFTSWRRWVAVPLLASAALLVVACGGPSVGDVEGQVLAMQDATKQPMLQPGVLAVIAGNGVNCGARTDNCIARTDAEGKYSFKGLPAAEYAIAFTPAVKEGEARLQEEARQFSVSAGKVETVSVVLLAEGIAKPEVPAELAQQARHGQGVSAGGGLTNNPFFWYFMFNQPWLGGYQRPPVVVYAPGSERTIVPDANRTNTSDGRYSKYGPDGAAGTKPAPKTVDSKGVTRPGSAALPGGGAGTSPALNNGSQGVTRPGQAPAGSAAGSGSSGAARPSDSTTTSPPRVGAGSGGTAPRAPAAPPRVRVGRR